MKRSKNSSHYIVLTDQHMYVGSLDEVRKQSGMMIEEREFKRIDGNYITKLDDQAIDFVIDKRRMSSIPWQHLVKKDMSLNYMMYVVLVILFVILVRG